MSFLNPPSLIFYIENTVLNLNNWVYKKRVQAEIESYKDSEDEYRRDRIRTN